MKILIILALFFTSQLMAFDAQFWGELQKYPTPKWRLGQSFEKTKTKPILFEGEPYNGKATEVFAFYCTPSMLDGNKTKDKNLPAIVCVHGGGGRAYPQWVELWAKRGYAAIAIDWRGNGNEPRFKNPTEEERKKYGAYKLTERIHLKNGIPEHNARTTSLDDGKSERDAWAYHAISAIIRAHSLIRSFDEVDKERTAITGISWGGYLTSLVSAIDTRFKAAVPVYGCGYIYEFPENWAKYIGKKNIQRWISLFDPSKSLQARTMPMLFVNSPTDRWYPLSIWTKSTNLANAKTLIISTLKHSHEHGWNVPEIEAFIASQINGGEPLIDLEELKTDGKSIFCKTTDIAKVDVAKIFYTTTNDKHLWKDFNWQSAPAQILDNEIRAELPPNTRAAYLSVSDTKKRTITTNAIILKP